MMTRSVIERTWSAMLGTQGEGASAAKILRHGREMEKLALRSIRDWVMRNIKTESKLVILSRLAEAISQIDRQIQVESQRSDDLRA